jgi:hypothetical protein
MNKIEEIFKDAKKTEKNLNSLLKREFDRISKENEQNGLSDYQVFASWCKYETDDMFTTPQKITDGEVCVWASNNWVAPSRPPKDVEMKEGRFPVKCVSMWYTPYCYMKTGMDVNELYNNAETEKVLYEDFDIKISMVRRNVIPFFHSVQYTHRITKHEYVLYLKRHGHDEEVEKEMEELYKQLKQFPSLSPERMKLSIKRQQLYKSLDYWHECFHADKLKDLEEKALYYFNDWYQ